MKKGPVNSASSLFVLLVQIPVKMLVPKRLSTRLDNVAVTRNDSVKVPAADSSCISFHVSTD